MVNTTHSPVVTESGIERSDSLSCPLTPFTLIARVHEVCKPHTVSHMPCFWYFGSKADYRARWFMRPSERQRSFGETVINNEVGMAEAGSSHTDEDFIWLWNWGWDILEQFVILVVLW